MRFFIALFNLICDNTYMNLDEIFNEIDLTTPLTDDELDYLDIIGRNPLNTNEGQSHFGEKIFKNDEKELDRFESPGVELVNISDCKNNNR